MLCYVKLLGLWWNNPRKTSLIFFWVRVLSSHNPLNPLLVKPSNQTIFLIMAKDKHPWPTVRRAGLVAATGLSEEYIRTTLKSSLQENMYWFRIPNSCRILWNLELVRDWLANGNSPAHAKAVEKYLASLPSSDTA
jgi:hypothetical protein